MRDPQTCIRYGAFAGMEGYEHRNMGLERDSQTGAISTNPQNHAQMVANRRNKVNQIANKIPKLEIQGDANADVVLVGWGSTEGHLKAAQQELHKQGKSVALVHFNYIQPLPSNTYKVLTKFKNIVVCELNSGQFANYLRNYLYEHSQGNLPKVCQYNKVEGQPFTVGEIVDFINSKF